MTSLRPLQSLILVVLLGCPSTAIEPNPPGQAYSFPHAEGFEAGSVHGQPWLQSPEGCVSCHLAEQRLRMVDSCRDCHVLYPHADDFADDEVHGPRAADDGFRCISCHGTGEAQPGEQEGSACRDCHQDYPHRLTWAEPEIHGPRAVEAPVRACAGCHGVDWQGSTTSDSCFDCCSSRAFSMVGAGG